MPRKMTSYEHAYKTILSEARPLAAHVLPLSAVLGKVLAENVISGIDDPPWDNSAMDGYGIKYRDTRGAGKAAPARLKVVGTLQAGQLSNEVLRRKEAVRIMTGAPVPRGVDAVVPVEDTTEKDGLVAVYKEVKKAAHIRRRGENIRAGQKALAKGTPLTPGHIGMLAVLGRGKVKVIRPPTVGILATGDELVEVEKKLPRGKIRDSNSHSLAASVAECGAEAVMLGIARDRPAALRAKIRRGLKCDALVICGGISMGKADYVRPVIDILKVKVKFAKVAQRPGQPFTYGTFGRVPVFCLPGNMVSSLVVFEIYVRPAILKMSGRRDLSRHQVTAILEEKIRVKKGKRYFLRVRLRKKKNRHYACLTGPQGSGVLKSMALADGLLTVPEDIDTIAKGERWPVSLLQS